MKFNKRVLAVLMAVLLMIPSMPISATGQAGAETVVQEVSSEKRRFLKRKRHLLKNQLRKKKVQGLWKKLLKKIRLMKM